MNALIERNGTVPRNSALRPLSETSLILAGFIALFSCLPTAVHAEGKKGIIGVVEQQQGNPFFATKLKATVAAAKKLGYDTMTASSTVAGDFESQRAGMETMIQRGAKAIILDPAGPVALNDIVKKARAAGIVIVTTNTSLQPPESAEASYETDNFAGGVLIGKWARAKLGNTPAHVAMLDYDLTNLTSKARHDGFLKGFGIAEGSPQIAASELTQGTVDTGQTAMENVLSAHKDVNVLYTINEPTAQGASFAIKKSGARIIVTSFDGGCPGVRSVDDGSIGATVMQFPTKMGEMAVAAAVKAIEGGQRPHGINDSGTVLITNQPMPGLESRDSKWGLANCWGD
jgi:fructose transport system substrate-binding protein